MAAIASTGSRPGAVRRAGRFRGRRRTTRNLRLPRPALPGLLLGLLGALLLAAGPMAPRARADAVGVDVTVLTSHVKSQRDAPVKYYRRKLDDAGRHIVTPGLDVTYDFDLDEPFWKAKQIRIEGGQVSDSAAHTFRYAAVMGRWMLVEGEKLNWSIQVGAGIIARKSWRDIPEYEPDNALRESDHFLPGWEWAVLPLGDLDLAWRFTPTFEGVWSVFPGVPYVIVQSLGVRWMF